MNITIKTNESLKFTDPNLTFASLLADLAAGNIKHETANQSTHMVLVADQGDYLQIASVLRGDYDGSGTIDANDTPYKGNICIAGGDGFAFRYDNAAITITN